MISGKNKQTKMKVKFPEIDSNKWIEKLPLWSILSFVVILFGFIGFYTYCASNNIPLVIPEIQLIFGIGFYNFLFIASLFLVQSSLWDSKADKALIIVGFFNFLLNNPVNIAIISILIIIIYSRGYWEKKWKIKPLKEKEENSVIESGSQVLEIIGFIGAGLLAFFKGPMIILQFFAIYILLYEAEKILKKKEIRFASLILGFVVIPIFVSYNFISKANFTIVGLYHSKVKLIQDGNELDGYILLRDGNDIYFKKELDSDSTIILNRGDFSKILVLGKSDKKSKPEKKDTLITNIDSSENTILKLKEDSIEQSIHDK